MTKDIDFLLERCVAKTVAQLMHETRLVDTGSLRSGSQAR